MQYFYTPSTRLDLILTRLDLILNSAKSHPHSARSQVLDLKCLPGGFIVKVDGDLMLCYIECNI